jgi:predicted transcriptional regulator
MDVLWEHEEEERTGREVSNALPAYAYTTIATVLDRLARKGEVRRRTRGQVHAYAATGSGATHAALAMREVLDDADDSGEALRRLRTMLSSTEATALLEALERDER